MKTIKVYRDRIGLNCFFDSMACLLEAEKVEYLALNFVHHRFLYNRKSLLTFCGGQHVVDLLSPTDVFFFSKDEILNLKYKKDYVSKTKAEFDKSIGTKLKHKHFSEDFYDEIKQFPRDDFPISLRVNPNAYAEFYAENNCIVPRSDCRHRVNIYRVDRTQNRAWMVDRGFDCLGAWIELKYLYDGATDACLKNEELSYSYISSSENMHLDKQGIIKLLEENIGASMEEEIEINYCKYLVNSAAFRSFKEDFFELIGQLDELSGGCAGQILGEAFVQHIDETRSIGFLFDSANRYLDLIEIDEILPFFEQYKKFWLQFESLLRICVYKGESIACRANEFMNLLEKLSNCNEEIMNRLVIIMQELKSVIL